MVMDLSVSDRWAILDRMPQVAEHYNHLSLDQIREITESISGFDARDRGAYELSAALTYNAVAKLYSSGEKDRIRAADHILTRLSEEDQAISTIDNLLSNFSDKPTFASISKEEGKLLTPSEIEEEVFRRYAPDSTEQIAEYKSKQGMAVIWPNLSAYGVGFSYRLEHTEEGKDRYVQKNGILITDQKLSQEIEDQFRHLKTQDFSQIIAKEKAMYEFVAGMRNIYLEDHVHKLDQINNLDPSLYRVTKTHNNTKVQA